MVCTVWRTLTAILALMMALNFGMGDVRAQDDKTVTLIGQIVPVFNYDEFRNPSQWPDAISSDSVVGRIFDYYLQYLAEGGVKMLPLTFNDSLGMSLVKQYDTLRTGFLFPRYTLTQVDDYTRLQAISRAVWQDWTG